MENLGHDLVGSGVFREADFGKKPSMTPGIRPLCPVSSSPKLPKLM